MSKIIYASSSHYELIRQHLEEYRQKELNLVFVPSSSFEYVFKERQEEELLECLDLTLKSIISLDDTMSNREWQQALLGADVIYLHGGNPVVFKDYLIEKECWELLKEHQGLLIGVSAGAMLLSENIVITPSNEEYPDFVNDPALNRGPINIYPHLNFSDVVTAGVETMDGLMSLEHFAQLSYDTPIDFLADDHFIVNEENKLVYLGDWFYRIDKGKLYLIEENQHYRIDITPTTTLEISDVTIFSDVYNSMEEALKFGKVKSLFNLDTSIKQQPSTLSLMNLVEEGYAYQQADLDHFKSWIIDNPQVKYCSLSYREVDGRVIERLKIRTRYMKLIEKLKIWPKII